MTQFFLLQVKKSSRWLCFFFLALLIGCNSTTYNQTEGNIADAKQHEAAARAHMDNLTKSPPPLVVKDSLYVDTTPVSLERQPEWLKNPIVVKGDQLPFSYYTGIITSAADGNVLSKYQSGLDQNTVMSISYSGTVKGALDLLAARSGYVYNIKKGNTIYWQAYITRTFSIAFMPGSQDYVMGQNQGINSASANTGTPTDSAANEFSALTGKSLSIWKDIDSTINQLLSPDGKVFVSQTSTSVTVKDRPTNVELVGQYVRNLNKSMSQQVFVKIEVIDVSLENDFNFGINWQAVENAFAHSNWVFNANYGSPLSITPLTGGTTLPNGGLAPNAATALLANAGETSLLSAVINALNQQAKTSVVAQPRVVCMNNQVSAVRIINSQQYIQSVSNTSVPSTSSSGGQTVNNVSTITSAITPAALTTGLTIYLLPKILNDKVYLQINVDLSQNSSITTLCAQTAGGASGTTGNACAESSYIIQSPHVTEKIFNQRSVLRSGETLVLSGLKQITNSTGAMQLFNVQELGGKASTQTNDDTVILVTPYLLNQSDHGTG